MSTYCIISQRSVGCTFFDWSIHFLSGQTQHYNLHQAQWTTLSTDPIQELNAHGHEKNHPVGFDNTQKSVNTLLSLPQDKLYSVYPCPLKIFMAADEKNLSMDQIHDNSVRTQIFQHIDADFDKMFQFCDSKNVKLIYVGEHDSTQLYHMHTRSLDGYILSEQVFDTVEDFAQHFQETFFANSINTWTAAGLSDIWDVRERQALDSRPFVPANSEPKSMTYPHLWINCQELWYNGEQAVLKMLKWLELAVDPTRLPAWRVVYAKWQAKQLQLLSFCHTYQHIVDSVVNNWYYEIDLTFEQEVVIQHCLIYQHNLNLKTWQLSKFPNNTQDLHKLLEPNIHSLTPY